MVAAALRDEWPENSQRLRGLVRRFPSVRAVVIGDAIIDHYHFGKIERISPEAPVPIFVEERDEVRRGGADNVAHQLEALRCQVIKVFPADRCTKHRYFVGHHQVFRRDEDRAGRPPELPHERPDADVVVLSDYAKGALTHGLCAQIMAWKLPVVVDPKGRDWSKYRGAAVICPNAREFADRPKDAPEVCFIEKRGADGIRLRPEPGVKIDIPAQARHVYDVTGAGDVVVAVIAAAVGLGCDLTSAATIATYAAGYAVGEVGTTVCPHQTLLSLLP